jgi:hypothetical protein
LIIGAAGNAENVIGGRDMKPKSVIGLAFVLAFGITSQAADDFQHGYELSMTREVRIRNTLGNIKVTDYSGTAIEVRAHVEGTNKDAVKVIDLSHPPQVNIIADCLPWLKNPDTKVDIEVKVPDSAKDLQLFLETANGIIDVNGFVGSLLAKSRRGNITVTDAKNNVMALSWTGNVDVKILKIGDRGIDVSSHGGNVKVAAPADLAAKVTMNTSMGTINTDFPIKITEGRYGGKIADGTLGSEKPMVSMKSVFGNVSLIKE